MSLKIRLSRGGAKKRPFYSIVIADSRSPRDGRFIEKIGTYNPMLPKEQEGRINIDQDRAKHWLSMGATPTDRVALFFGNAGLIEKRQWTETPNRSKPKAKAQERAKANEAASAAPAEKAPAAAPAEAPVEEAPAEEIAAEAPVVEEAAAPVEEAGAAEAAPEEAATEASEA
jgi:small subunit ribosomal protein S16